MTLTHRSATANSWRHCIAFIGLAVLCAGLFTSVWHQISKGFIGAFQTFYPAAVALRQGRSPYDATHGVFAYIYPPFYAFVLQPLALLSQSTAARIMMFINGGFIFAALLLGSRAMLERLGAKITAAKWGLVALSAAIVTLVPIYNELRGLETNSVLLLSFVLALYWLDRRPIWAGLSLAVSINIKYLPIIAVPYLLLRRRWTAAIATLSWSIALALLPATTLGWGTNLKYLQVALSGLTHLAGVQTAGPAAHVHDTDVKTSISITSALSRLATESGRSKHAGMVMTAAVAALWAASILPAYVRRRLPLLRWPDAAGQRGKPFDALLAIEWTGLIVFALAFSPNTQNRNLVLSVVPATLAVVLALSSSVRAARVLPLIAIAVMCAGLVLPIASMGKPFTVFWVSHGCLCWVLLAEYALLSWIALGRIGARNDAIDYGRARTES